MPSITTPRSRLGGCDWLPNTRLNPGSVTKSCEGVGRGLEISKETLRGWCRQRRSMPASGRGSAEIKA